MLIHTYVKSKGGTFFVLYVNYPSKSLFVQSFTVFALYEGPPPQINLILIFFIVPLMIKHTRVKSVGGTLFSFYM